MTLPMFETKEKTELLTKYDVWEEKFNNKGYCIGRNIKLPNLGELIYTGIGMKFLTVIDNQQIYRYNGGFYESDGEQIIRKLVEDFLTDETKEHYKNEVVGYIRDKDFIKREIFDGNKQLLNLHNGVYDLRTNEFTNHSHEYYFLNEIPITYDPEADCPNIKEFFSQVVRPEDVPVLQEIFGYCLYRGYPIQKAIMFLGQGANGKSTTLSLLIEFLGKANVSSISLQDLGESRFACASLYSKLANIYPDITDKALHKTGIFKMVTGGDMLTAERKFQDPFNFYNYAKLIFSANKLPEAKDDTDAYFRRWIFINFPHTFEGDQRDPNIIDKLTTDEELSGLLNFALEGLKRLLENKSFTNSSTTDEMRELYQRLASPIAAFVMDCIEISPEEFIVKDDLYASFIEYCTEKGLPVVAKNVFSMRLHEHVKVNDYRPNVNGKRVYAWQGIRLQNTQTAQTSGGHTQTAQTETSGNTPECLGGLGIFLPNACAGKNNSKVKKRPSLDATDKKFFSSLDQDGISGFQTIKKNHVDWAKNILMNHLGMPFAIFEKEFYNEFGTEFLADEIQRLHKTVTININQLKEVTDGSAS